jgi:hypothetical protein
MLADERTIGMLRPGSRAYTILAIDPSARIDAHLAWIRIRVVLPADARASSGGTGRHLGLRGRSGTQGLPERRHRSRLPEDRRGDRNGAWNFSVSGAFDALVFGSGRWCVASELSAHRSGYPAPSRHGSASDPGGRTAGRAGTPGSPERGFQQRQSAPGHWRNCRLSDLSGSRPAPDGRDRALERLDRLAKTRAGATPLLTCWRHGNAPATHRESTRVTPIRLAGDARCEVS